MTKSKSRVCWRVWGKVLRIATGLCSPLLLFQQYRPLSQLPSTLQRWFNIFPYWILIICLSTGVCVILIGPIDGETNIVKWKGSLSCGDFHCIALHCIALVGIVGWVVHSLLGCKHKNISHTGTRHCQPEPRYLENQAQDTWKLEVCIRTSYS